MPLLLGRHAPIEPERLRGIIRSTGSKPSRARARDRRCPRPRTEGNRRRLAEPLHRQGPCRVQRCYGSVLIATGYENGFQLVVRCPSVPLFSLAEVPWFPFHRGVVRAKRVEQVKRGNLPDCRPSSFPGSTGGLPFILQTPQPIRPVDSASDSPRAERSSIG